MGEILSIVFTLIILVAALFFTYFATRFIATKFQYKGATKNLTILDRVIIQSDKSLLIASAAEKVLLLAVAKDSVTLLCELDGEKIVAQQPEDKEDFAGILKQLIIRKTQSFQGKGEKEE